MSDNGAAFAPWIEHVATVEVVVRDADGALVRLRGIGRFTPSPKTDDEAAEHHEDGWSRAVWIAGTDFAGAVDDDPREDRSAPILTRTFTLEEPPERALLFFAVGGIGYASIDGRPVGNEVLQPGTVHWNRRVPGMLRDVTDALGAPGEHTLEFELGRGFYGMTNANVWGWEKAPWHAEPTVRAALRLEYPDGRIEWVATGADWLTTLGPVLLDDMYGGESVDLRRLDAPLPGTPAVVVRGPTGTVEPRRTPAERRVEFVDPISISRHPSGAWVVAFPRVISGWVRVDLPASDGAVVEFRYGERLRPDGLPNADDEMAYFHDGFQTDVVTLGAEPRTWEPRFSYKGFRFVSILGWPTDEGPSPTDVMAVVVRSDVRRTAEVAIADPLLQWMHDATAATIANNLHDYPTDTPKYEKNGWTGDGMLGAEMILRTFDTVSLMEKWVGDIAETTSPVRPPALIAPNAGWFGVDTVAPVWHSALVEVPWEIYQLTGDDRILSTHWSEISEYLRFESARSPGWIADTILGDWVAPGTDPGGGNPPEDQRVPATAFLCRMLDTGARIADVIGRTTDAAEFAASATAAREAYRARFFDRTAGIVRGEEEDALRQTHQVLALAFDLLEPEDRARVATALALDVRARGDRLDTGAIGTRWLLPVLEAHGHGDVAVAIARQTAPPSWGAWWQAGMTSMLEHWDLRARSHGHYFLGTVDDWLVSAVVGLQRTSPGWATFTVAPTHTDRIDAAGAEVDTVYGIIRARYERHGDRLIVDVAVPVGTTAVVGVPGCATHRLHAGEHRLEFDTGT